MKMEWFELASRSVVVLDQVNSFREESALHWGPVVGTCLLYTSPSPRDGLLSRMPSSA